MSIKVRTEALHGAGYRIGVLGPVQGWLEEENLNFGSPRQQAVISIFAAQAEQVISKGRLIDGVWGESAPATAEQSVYTYVAGLRRALEPGRRQRAPSRLLVSASGGYVLRLGRDQVDSIQFERHFNQAVELKVKKDYESSLLTLIGASHLWRGQALSGVPGPFADTERRRLSDLHLGSRELHADVLLSMGRHQEAVTDLESLVHEHPLRERLRELLMVALYRCGRQADALSVFDETRNTLAEELGLDPGKNLRRCHELILRADPALDPPAGGVTAIRNHERPASVPKQLPRPILGFIGRSAELVRLRSLLMPWDGSAPHPAVVIVGAPGAGKSALAVQAAHAAREHFPDGQLYANLHGATPGVQPLAPNEVLSRFLRALLVPAEAVPLEVDEASALLRERLYDRRFLIVMDNAATLEQVRPVLSIPQGNAILVTSRETFAAADDCTQLRLSAMSHSEAVTMLAKLVDAERVATSPSATTRLVHLCGGLPLALRLAAARLVDRPHWNITDLVARLDNERRVLDELELGDVAVRTSLQLSHDLLARSDRTLDRTAGKMLCRLGVLDVPDVTPDVAAALLDIDIDLAERALGRLVDGHMAELDAGDRFQLHDLVRLFARELSERSEPQEARQAALNQAIGHYSATTRLAVKLLDPHRVQPPGPKVEREPYPLAESDEAYDWLERERPNLLAAAAQAMASESEHTARLGALLASSLVWYLYRAGHRTDNLLINREVLLAGKHLDDPQIEALAHGHIARAMNQMGQPAEAAVHQETELALQRGLGDRFAEMRALGNLGVMYGYLGRHEEALTCSQDQLMISREIDSGAGERHALIMIGKANRALGRFAPAMACLEDVLLQTREADDGYQESLCLVTMGEVLLDQNEPRAAKIHFQEGLTRARAVKYRALEPECLSLLARANRLLNSLDHALACIKEAIALARLIGDKRWGEAAAKEQSAIFAAFTKSLSLSSQGD